jgi:ferredoxin
MNLERGYAVKCDLCGGDPECVKACPYDAIDFEIVLPQRHEYTKKRYEV